MGITMSRAERSGSVGPHNHHNDWKGLDYDICDIGRDVRITIYSDGCVTWSSSSPSTPEQISGAINAAIKRATDRVDSLQRVRDQLAAAMSGDASGWENER